MISDYVDLLNKNYPIIVQECLDAAPNDKKEYVDASTIESHIMEFNCLVKNLISKNIVFSFKFENLENFEFI